MKKKANDAFSSKKYEEAIKLYTECLQIPLLTNKERSILYSNRSVTHLKLGNPSKAYYDAKLSIEYSPNWPKAYYRKGMALYNMKNYEKAIRGNVTI